LKKQLLFISKEIFSQDFVIAKSRSSLERFDLNNMIWTLSLIFILHFHSVVNGQEQNTPYKTEVMTLGVFHFDYPNLDVVRTEEKR
jgi:hypothetical protein